MSPSAIAQRGGYDSRCREEGVGNFKRPPDAIRKISEVAHQQVAIRRDGGIVGAEIHQITDQEYVCEDSHGPCRPLHTPDDEWQQQNERGERSAEVCLDH